MDTVTSFSASLLQSLDNDTEKSAEIANMAITDMSDNANKMGTDMATIQVAYQSFAKQQFQLLDNSHWLEELVAHHFGPKWYLLHDR